MKKIKSIDGYTNLAEVLTETKQVMMVSLSAIVENIAESDLANFPANPNGIYAPGRIKPTLNFDRSSYIDGSYIKTFSVDRSLITSLKDFIQAENDIITNIGSAEAMLFKDAFVIPRVLRKRYSDKSPLNMAAYDFAHQCVIETASALLFKPSLQIRSNEEEIESLVDKGAPPAEFSDIVYRALNKTQYIDQINTFIGEDIYHYYRLYRQNASLRIEKGNDARIVEYYSRLFDIADNEDEGKPVDERYDISERRYC